MQVKTKHLVCATSWQDVTPNHILSLVTLTRRVPPYMYVYDNLQQTAGQADAHYCTCSPLLPVNPQVSFIHAGKVHETDQLGLSIEVDPVEVMLVFLKLRLTLAVTTFLSPLVAR